ncbi:hypothetical protein YC2023_090256 [Brassica napus]
MDVSFTFGGKAKFGWIVGYIKVDAFYRTDVGTENSVIKIIPRKTRCGIGTLAVRFINVRQIESGTEERLYDIYLSKPCEIEFDYLVRYDKTVSGHISYGSSPSSRVFK